MKTENDTNQANEGRVRVSAMIDVPPVFRSWVPAVHLADGEVVHAVVVVEMVGGKERVKQFALERALAPTELQTVDWVALAQQALLIQAFKETALNVEAFPDDEKAQAFIEHDLVEAFPAEQTNRTYNRMRYEDYERVAAAWERGGPKEVRRTFHVSLRQANRYVAKTKEFGLL